MSHAKIKDFLPEFYEAVKDFPDFRAEAGLDCEAIAALEKKLEFEFTPELRELFRHSAAISMNGLAVKAAELGPIVMPGSDAMIIGEFYLYNPGDRLLMLPCDASVYYLEQRNGAITKLAGSVREFFNIVLPRILADTTT